MFRVLKVKPFLRRTFWRSCNSSSSITNIEKDSTVKELDRGDILRREFEEDPLEAAKKHEEQIPTIKEHFGEKSEELLSNLEETTVLYKLTGKYDKCLEYLEKQKELSLEIDGPISFRQSSILLDMGGIYQDLKNYPKAKENLEKAYDLAIKSVGIYNSKVTNEENTVLSTKELKENAKEIINKDALLSGQILMLKAAGSLGRLYESLGDTDSAIYYYLDATINLPDNILGYSMQNADHPHYCSLLNPLLSSYGSVYFDKNFQMELDEAKIVTQKQIGDHSQAVDTKDLVKLVGEFKHPSEHIKEAKFDAEMSYKALLIQEKYIGKENPIIIPSIANTAWNFLRCGDINKTEDLWNRILAIERRVSGPYSCRSATALGALGITKYFQQDFYEAERLIKKAIRLKQESYERRKWLHVALLQYDLGHVLMQVDQKEAMDTFVAVSDHFKGLPNGAGSRRHPWFQLTLDSIASIGHGGDAAKQLPVKDYNLPPDEQPNLYDYGGRQLR